MLVKDLIERLSQVNPELKVLITYTDHTDWDYKLPLREQDVNVEEVDYEFEDDVIENETCLTINLSFDEEEI
jgi:hypothetical protein